MIINVYKDNCEESVLYMDYAFRKRCGYSLDAYWIMFNFNRLLTFGCWSGFIRTVIRRG